jgi:SAM-dependent methyltransferase
MIKVLRDWRAIGEAHISLARQGLPQHDSCEKAWDLYGLYQVLRTVGQDSRVIDLGCGGLFALRLADAMGFDSLSGVDLAIPLQARLVQAKRMWRQKTVRVPFSLRRMSITRLRFVDQSFDLAVAISTIEHGVDLPRFFSEVGRILRSGGLLFITTDYWEERIQVDPLFRAYGRSWTIFDRHDIEAMLSLAQISGLVPLDPTHSDLRCGEKCVAWGGHEYTFICMVFRKAR